MRLALGAITCTVAACGPSVASVTVEPQTLMLRQKGETKALKATPLRENNELAVEALLKIVWTSSDPNVATVNGGNVTAIRSGDSIITAAVGDRSASARVTVSIPAKLTLDPPTLEVPGIGRTIMLEPKVLDEAGRPALEPSIIWSTSSSTVAMVVDGKIEGTGIGSANITATIGSLKSTAVVTVKHPEVGDLTLTPPGPHTLEKIGDAVRLQATPLDPNKEPIKGMEITWTTSDEKVAPVSSEGLITAAKKGKAKITASAAGKTAETEVTVVGAK